MADIAINPVVRRVQFTGNTGTGPFAFTFNILQDADITVYKNTTLLTLTTDYTVSTNANGTGSITLVAGQSLISSDVLTIIGGRELSRTTDFVTAGDLLASSLNEQLDSNVIMTQQLDEKFERAVRQNPGDEDGDMILPLKADRTNKFFKFDANGNPGVQSSLEITGQIIGSNYTANNFTGDGSDTTFTLSTEAGSKNNMQVYIDGVYQQKNSYSLSGTTLTFSEAPPNNASIEVVIGTAIESSDNATAVSYVQPYSTASVRTVQSRIEDTISVKDFGAVGDDTTDDTEAIKAAISACQTALLKLHFPAGQYKITEPITFDKIDVSGDGELTSTIRGYINNDYVVYLSRGGSIENMRIDAINATTSGIRFNENVYRHHLNRVHIRQVSGGNAVSGTVGILYDGGTFGSGGTYWNYINDCQIRYFENGFETAGDSTAAYIVNTNILNCGKGMELNTTGYTNTITVVNGTMEACSTHGVQCSANSCTFIGCRFEGSPIGFEQAGTAQNNMLSGCFFAGNSTAQIQNSSGNRLTIISQAEQQTRFAGVPYAGGVFQEERAVGMGAMPKKDITGTSAVDLVDITGSPGVVLLYISTKVDGNNTAMSSGWVQVYHQAPTGTGPVYVENEQNSNSINDFNITRAISGSTTTVKIDFPNIASNTVQVRVSVMATSVGNQAVSMA